MCFREVFMADNNIANGESSKYLVDVPGQNYFILSNGKSVSNLERLYDAVHDSEQEVFYHHVTPDKNDFTNWIKYCIKDDALCDKLLPIKEREAFLGILAEEIAILKDSKLLETLKYFSEDIYDNHNGTDTMKKVYQQPAAPAELLAGSSVESAVPAVESLVPLEADSSAASLSNANVGNPSSSGDIGKSSNLGNTDSISAQALNTDNDETFDFESVLKNIMDDIEKDILSWET